MKELIPRYDIHGVQIKEGDIIAESKIGKIIWDEGGIIESRPIGVVVVYKEPKIIESFSPDEDDAYNVRQLRKGRVLLTDKAKIWHKESLSYDCGIHTELNITTYDGGFYGWDNNIEIIGSIYDFCD